MITAAAVAAAAMEHSHANSAFFLESTEPHPLVTVVTVQIFDANKFFLMFLLILGAIARNKF